MCYSKGIQWFRCFVFHQMREILASLFRLEGQTKEAVYTIVWPGGIHQIPTGLLCSFVLFVQSNESVYPMQLVEFVSVDSTFANAFYFCSGILIVSILLAFLLDNIYLKHHYVSRLWHYETKASSFVSFPTFGTVNNV